MKCLKILVLGVFVLFVSGANKLVFAVPITEQKISANFNAIKVRDLLYLLTERSGKNVIISEKISGKVSIDFQKISWREALDALLQMQGLVKRETANLIIITPVNELDKKEALPMQPAVFNLHHASAENISKIIGPAGVLSQAGKAQAEVRTNALVVADANDKVENLKNLLKQIDVPVKQVLIEARIVSADENFIRDLGLEFGMIQPEETEVDHKRAANLHRGKFNFNITKLSNDSLLDLELTALENEGRGKVISSPKLITADRQAAYIESGAEIPYQEKTKKGDISIAFKKAVLSLKVTPEIATNNSINLLLQLNQDKVSQLTINGVPAIDTRKIQTQVLVRNGETVVLGGIYEWSKSNYVVGVPVLRKIPILGALFRKQESKMERKELLMFVTPHIIY
jgi:type IV pilus assembly protein PilQ